MSKYRFDFDDRTSFDDRTFIRSCFDYFDVCKLRALFSSYIIYKHVIGILHVMVSRRLQLRNIKEDRRTQFKHRRAGLHGPPFCR